MKINLKHTKKFIPIIIIGIVFTTVAFAKVTYNLNASGSMAVGLQDGIIISDVSVSDASNDSSARIDHYVSTFLTNTVNIGSQNSYVTIAVTVKNTGTVKHRFDGILYDDEANKELGAYSNSNIIPEIVSGDNGISANTIINGNETKKIYIRYYYNGSNFSESGESLSGTIKLNMTRLYEINYVLNGGTQANNQLTTYASGETVTLLDPSKTNADFEGWYTSSDFTGTKVTQITNSQEDITLYAHFLNYYNLYFQMPPDWYKDDNADDYSVYAYLYNTENTNINEAWPGTSMTHNTSVDSGSTKMYIYSYRAREDYLDRFNRIIFSNGIPSSRTIVEEDKKNKQTIDITLSSTSYGKIFVPELYKNSKNANEVRIFAKANYNFHYYTWNSSNGENLKGWPGTLFETSVSDNLFQATVDRSRFDKMIINRGNGAAQTQNFDTPATSDLTFAYSDEYSYFYVVRYYYGGSFHNYDDWLDHEYNSWTENGDYVVFNQTDSIIEGINYYLN